VKQYSILIDWFHLSEIKKIETFHRAGGAGAEKTDFRKMNNYYNSFFISVYQHNQRSSASNQSARLRLSILNLNLNLILNLKL